MQDSTIIVCNKQCIIQILVMILVEFCSCLFIGCHYFSLFNDFIGLLKVTSGASADLWVTAAFIVAAEIIYLLVCGQATALW